MPKFLSVMATDYINDEINYSEKQIAVLPLSQFAPEKPSRHLHRKLLLVYPAWHVPPLKQGLLLQGFWNGTYFHQFFFQPVWKPSAKAEYLHLQCVIFVNNAPSLIPVIVIMLWVVFLCMKIAFLYLSIFLMYFCLSDCWLNGRVFKAFSSARTWSWKLLFVELWQYLMNHISDRSEKVQNHSDFMSWDKVKCVPLINRVRVTCITGRGNEVFFFRKVFTSIISLRLIRRAEKD